MRRAGALVVGMTLAVLPSAPAAGAEEESFAFIQSFDEGHTHYVVLSDNAGGRQRKVSSQRAIGRPAFSPDGRRLAFSGPISDDSDGRYGIYVINADGTRLDLLTEPEFADLDPAWSPDGQWLAFSRDLEGSSDPATCCELSLVRPDGTGRRSVAGTTGATYPAWDPTSTQIAYQTVEGLWVVEVDGEGRKLLVEGSAAEPVWSPDGELIAYVERLSETRSRLMTVAVGGAERRIRVDMEAQLESPVWSPDGETIYFGAYQGAGYDGRSGSAVWRSRSEGNAARVFEDDWEIHHLAHSAVWLPAFQGPFADVPASHTFAVEIDWLAVTGITRGCNPPQNDLFCPEGVVTRGQMAAFLVRALGLVENGAGDLFTDDDASVFEEDIDRLGTAGIARGCDPPANRRFCPELGVSRAQTASFLVRALDYREGARGDLFIDDDGSVHEGDIDRLATAGVTRGCNPPANDRFCPEHVLTRGEMAALLYRALADG